MDSVKSGAAPPPLIWSVRVLAMISGAAMASTGECEPLFLFLYACFFLLGLKISQLPRLGRGISAAQTYVALVIFFIAVIDLIYLSRSFLLSVAHFLLSLQALQLLLLRTTRENLGSALISSLMILSASTLAVEWTFFLMLSLYLPALIWTLMMHTIVSGSQMGGKDEGPVEALPLDQKSPLWRRMMPVLRRSSAMAFLVSVLCCAFVFIIFPRFNFRGFRGQFLQPVRKTGFTHQVDLGKSQKIYTDDSIVMRVEVSESDFYLWDGYLRGGTLELFDNRLWKKAPYPTQRVFQTRRGQIRLPVLVDDSRPRFKSTVYLESMDSSLLFAVAQPVHLEIDRPVIEMSPDSTLQRTLGDSWRIHYKVESVLPPSREQARSAPLRSGSRVSVGDTSFDFNRVNRTLFGIPPGYESYSLSLPEAPLDKIRAFSKEITRGARSEMEAALRVENYLQENFQYDLGPYQSDANKNPIEVFLFDRKRGHCEYFASAMCLMLRYNGIPSRIATGFLSREWNEQGSYFVVRMRNAHAWIEAYIEPWGWVRFDPTPRVDGPAFGPDWIKRWDETWDYFNLRWNRYILSYDFERQRSIVESVVDRSEHLSGRLGRMGTRFATVFSALIPKSFPWKIQKSESPREFHPNIKWAGPLVLALGVLIFLIVQRWKRMKSPVWFYGALLKYLESKGGKKPDYQTLQEFSQGLSSDLGDQMNNVMVLLKKYYALRFDPTVSRSLLKDPSILRLLRKLK